MGKKGLGSDFAVDRIERELVQGILRGRFPANQFLPRIERLCQGYGVGYHTVRSAIGRLIARGLVVTIAGSGYQVVDLQSSIDLRLLLEIIDEAGDDPIRRWNLVTQLCGFARFTIGEIVDRAARHRDDTQLEWLRHLIRLLTDRLAIQAPRDVIGDCELQVMRVLAAASGCVTNTAIINSVRALFVSELLAVDNNPLVSLNDYWALMEAVANCDPNRAREVIDAAWWKLEERCINELKKLGWTETPGGASPG
jgi:DNA-binding FadR family transcriptional regulator